MRAKRRTDVEKPAKNTVCLWYDRDAEDAARFYAETFPDSSVTAVHRAPGDFPSGKQGDVLTVEFTVMGIPCIGLNGGPEFKHTEAFSFQVATDDQAETDRYWNAIVGNGGEASACGWCKDKWGLSWQITPLALTKAISDPDPAAAKRAFDAMMEMKKIDIAAIEDSSRSVVELLKYKLARVNLPTLIDVKGVAPKRDCSQCGTRSSNNQVKALTFTCAACGYAEDRHTNTSREIARRVLWALAHRKSPSSKA
jgi:predicted 3-demethylubiquinone-9 3-methyltransferase (glyoxalase superfamily)